MLDASPQNLSFLSIALAAVFFMWIERKLPYNQGQKLFRNGFWLDMLKYNFIQSFILGMVISWIVSRVDSSTGFSQKGVLAGWPVWQQVLFFLVTHDFYIYWMHRAQHRFPKLWKIHEAHHSTPDVDWLSGVRSHPLEILINQTVEFAPIILLAAAPEVPAWKGAISAIWGMFIHANLDVRLGKLQYVINGPEMHRWHHANSDEKAMNKNFGTKFAFWDWIFGTAYFPNPNVKKASQYGLEEEGYPSSYWGQVFWAVKTRKTGT